jgi:hypothetical protein
MHKSEESAEVIQGTLFEFLPSQSWDVGADPYDFHAEYARRRAWTKNYLFRAYCIGSLCEKLQQLAAEADEFKSLVLPLSLIKGECHSTLISLENRPYTICLLSAEKRDVRQSAKNFSNQVFQDLQSAAAALSR